LNFWVLVLRSSFSFLTTRTPAHDFGHTLIRHSILVSTWTAISLHSRCLLNGFVIIRTGFLGTRIGFLMAETLRGITHSQALTVCLAPMSAHEVPEARTRPSRVLRDWPHRAMDMTHEGTHGEMYVITLPTVCCCQNLKSPGSLADIANGLTQASFISLTRSVVPTGGGSASPARAVHRTRSFGRSHRRGTLARRRLRA
jgi:hypothetical protein